jgi:hypothetical protein
MQEEMTQDHSAEIENPDTEVEDCADEIVGTLEAAFDLLIERREAALTAAGAPLDAEKESLRQEYTSIGEAAQSLELLLPAKARIAQSEADQFTVVGKSEEAKAKLEEMRQAENAPEVMRARQREIAARIQALEAEKQSAARTIFETTWYSEAQSVVRAAERGLFCTLLDGLKASFYEYQERTGTGGTLDRPFSFLVKDLHLQNLTAPERSEEWQAGSRWYGGGR